MRRRERRRARDAHPLRSAAGSLQSEINVTPLVDVVLVLLIIFMVIVPLALRGYDVDIPESAAAAPRAEPKPEQVVLRIDLAGCALLEPPGSGSLPADCRVRINDDRVPLEDLPRSVAQIFASRALSDRVLFLAVEERLNYEGVLRIVDLARSDVEGLRIGLVTVARGV